MVIKILDNFVLDIGVARLQHGTQQVAPHGLALARCADSAEGCNPRAHHRHGDLLHLDHSRILGRPSTKGRDGHHKKSLFPREERLSGRIGGQSRSDEEWRWRIVFSQVPTPAGYKAVTAALFPRGCAVRLRFAAERPSGRRRGSSSGTRRLYSFLAPRCVMSGLSGGRTTPGRKDAAGPPYPREQSVLDEAVSARGPAGLTRALTLQEVLQILSKKSSGAAPAAEHPSIGRSSWQQ